jgi:tRNA G18 (ribose-2'-O)-methylase SpoU
MTNTQTEKYLNSFNVKDEYKELTLQQIQAKAKQLTKGFAVAAFNLKGDLNLGSIIRTALLTGAENFYILGHRQFDRRSSVGAQNYINVEKHDECVDWLTSEKAIIGKGYSPTVVEQGGVIFKDWLAIPIYNSNSLPPCFIFGPEEGFKDDWPAHIELEQTSVGRSYNVSAAAAIVLYQWSFR